jgi:hypothetical protein
MVAFSETCGASSTVKICSQAARGVAGMNKERIFTVLLAPHVSEKATMVGEQSNAVV